MCNGANPTLPKGRRLRFDDEDEQEDIKICVQ